MVSPTIPDVGVMLLTCGAMVNVGAVAVMPSARVSVIVAEYASSGIPAGTSIHTDVVVQPATVHEPSAAV